MGTTTLFDMLPVYPSYNKGNGHKRDPKFSSQFRLCYSIGKHFSYLSYFFWIQFCSMTLLSIHVIFWILKRASSFRIAILHVLCVGSQKQVFRIAASWIITFMANLVSFWNLSICQNPCRFARQKHPFKRRSKSEFSISIWIYKCFPWPTFIRGFYFHLRPKTGFYSFRNLLKYFRVRENVYLHSIIFVNCLPRLRLFVQRSGIFIVPNHLERSII